MREKELPEFFGCLHRPVFENTKGGTSMSENIIFDSMGFKLYDGTEALKELIYTLGKTVLTLLDRADVVRQQPCV